MKIFIGGSKTIESIDDVIKHELLLMVEGRYNILIGDCKGVDTVVQKFLNDIGYANVDVYASNGIVRNNLGNWNVHNILVEESIKGFEFYRQKDIAMANDADCGFMIWDEKSKGTLNNLIELTNQNKETEVYLLHKGERYTIRNSNELSSLITKLGDSILELFKKYMKK